jgi:hypothetical protein
VFAFALANAPFFIKSQPNPNTMKIGQPFNKLTFKEYFYYIPQHKKYTDFNTLGLYRSILENEKLSVEQKIEVRDYANQFFGKFFEFLQVKDPYTHCQLSILGKNLSEVEIRQQWRLEFSNKMEKILVAKNIKHRNFGIYSVHECGNPECFMKGLMTRQNSHVATFGLDEPHNSGKKRNKWAKSVLEKNARKQARQNLRTNWQAEEDIQED